MRLSDFDYSLPRELIAQYPLPRRDACRLLVVHRATGELEHRRFSDLGEYLARGDALVLNDTKVLACRLEGKRATGGRVEVFLLRRAGAGLFEALVSPGRVKINERIFLADGRISCTLVGGNLVRFGNASLRRIYGLGQVPLPPYIKRRPEPRDTVLYQTVYCRKQGSVASPTAGLHFTRAMLERLSASGVRLGYLTLHVGLATFKPVSCEDVTGHVMGRESFFIPRRTCDLLARTRRHGGRICCVGTTCCRALETCALGIRQGETGLFILPGHRFRMVDMLLTNFHLPRTTLFVLVCAFAGTDLAHAAYARAVERTYRFYSYGDAMLIV